MNQAAPRPMSPWPNTSALQALAGKLGIDAVIATSPENFIYASCVCLMSVSRLRRQAFVILPAAGEPVALVATTERKQTAEESWIKDVRTYTEYTNDPADALADILIGIGKDRGTIGIDLNYLPAGTHARLVSRMPNVRFIDTSKYLAAIRAVKLPAEIELLERSAKQTHRAVLEAMSASRLGETERVMANRITDGVVSKGAEEIAFLIFASGPRTSYNHARPTDRVPLKSEIIRLDVGGKYGAWGSDFARTYSTGEPTLLQRETYRKLWDLHTSTINMVRPGIAAEEPYFFCREQAEKLGLNFNMVFLGHSFGVENHEFPMIRPGEKAKLEVGMVFNIEPMVTDADGSMYHIEDLFVVTEQGPRVLTLGFGSRDIPIIGEPIRL
ncbi:M24 family metallopeptidase [Bradyrhizobium vignae]|uniref:Putative Xaa-Pro dipeptidase n=1 Tax=Bradyrhizobium vignae TaxID=1549949 RepID=A0A2U3Q9N1_9BRAD|nr:Xaa-Pro peptidase family protein [Bradyrhizobium vignae]SPP98096.1 putative Xaa-Pro dipeptidase [Bradyrhizobium vignae]